MYSLPLIQVVPPNGNGGSISNLTIKIHPKKFNYLKKELGADKIFVVYEDERSVILAGINSSTRMVKVPKAWLYGNIKSLVSIVPHR